MAPGLEIVDEMQSLDSVDHWHHNSRVVQDKIDDKTQGQNGRKEVSKVLAPGRSRSRLVPLHCEGRVWSLKWVWVSGEYTQVCYREVKSAWKCRPGREDRQLRLNCDWLGRNLNQRKRNWCHLLEGSESTDVELLRSGSFWGLNHHAKTALRICTEHFRAIYLLIKHDFDPQNSTDLLLNRLVL